MKAGQIFDLTGVRALVTGASSGLGARFARVLAANGAAVAVAARRSDRLAALVDEIGASGGRAAAVALDVSARDGLPGGLDGAEAALGGPVNLLINNAGVADGKRALDITAEGWDHVMRVNVDGVFFLAQLAAKRLAAAGEPGSIINVSSILGYRTPTGSAAYCVSKSAVAQMTQALAVDLARYRIRVNAIAPGYVETEMTAAYLASERGQKTIANVPLRRAGDVGDLDGALLLLASPRASAFMTGATITVDGGHMWSFL